MRNKLDLLDKFRKRLHPLLLKGVEGRIDIPIKVLNSMPEVQGNKLFAINHSCVLDGPVSSKVIEEHFYFLVGKQSLDLIDRIFFFLNGVVYVDRKSKKNKKKSLNRMLKLLREGKSLLICPEGTWNLTPSKPLLPMYWGCIEIAKQAQVPIIPLILEFKEKDVYAKFGEPVYVMPSDKKGDKFEELREKMATLKWEIWEQFPAVPREEIDMDEWEREKEARIAAYPKLNYEYEMSCVRKA